MGKTTGIIRKNNFAWSTIWFPYILTHFQWLSIWCLLWCTEVPSSSSKSSPNYGCTQWCNALWINILGSFLQLVFLLGSKGSRGGRDVHMGDVVHIPWQSSQERKQFGEYPSLPSVQLPLHIIVILYVCLEIRNEALHVYQSCMESLVHSSRAKRQVHPEIYPYYSSSQWVQT